MKIAMNLPPKDNHRSHFCVLLAHLFLKVIQFSELERALRDNITPDSHFAEGEAEVEKAAGPFSRSHHDLEMEFRSSDSLSKGILRFSDLSWLLVAPVGW